MDYKPNEKHDSTSQRILLGMPSIQEGVDAEILDYLSQMRYSSYHQERLIFEQFIKGTARPTGQTIFQYTSAPNRAIAKLQNPPIENGMTFCFRELAKILQCEDDINKSIKTFVPRPSELKRVSTSSLHSCIRGLRTIQIPILLLRIKVLLDVQWSYQTFGTDSALIKYCDVQEPIEVNTKVAELGAYLGFAETLVDRLFSSSTEAMDLIINKLFEVKCEQVLDIAEAYGFARNSRLSHQQRIRLYEALTCLDMYRAHDQMAKLIVPTVLKVAYMGLTGIYQDWSILVVIFRSIFDICILGDLGSRMWGLMPARHFVDLLVKFVEHPLLLKLGSVAALFGMAVSALHTSKYHYCSRDNP